MEKRKPITHHLLSALERPADWIAVRFKRHKDWLPLTWSDYYKSIEAAGGGLAALDVTRGDRVAIVSNTRLEWAVLDFAILGLGAVNIPVYQSHRPDEIEYILQNSEPRVLIVEDGSQLRKWESIAKRCKSVEHVVILQPTSDMPKSVMSWDELLNKGVEFIAKRPEYFKKEILRTTLEETATIVYTSGTTGEPKGALLTHAQVLSEVEDVARAFPISPMDESLSFLPYAHVLGRIELWLHTYIGFTMNMAESIDRLKSNLAQTRPTVLMGVPRIFEKIYAGMLAQIEGHPLRKQVFSWLSNNQGWWQNMIADRLLFAKLRDGLGGRLRFVVSGGAPLEPQLAQFFQRAGLLLLEGYGLTETTAAICANTPMFYKFGTVGRPLPEVKIKIAEDGEILVKSTKVMREYYKDSDATASVFKDGYFCTGDVGELTEDGYLRITDRKKDLIKTAGGKYVAPQKLEGLLKMSPLISHALIHGDRRKYVVALITLDEAYLKTMARENGWSFRDYRALTQLPEVQEQVRKAVASVNSQLASYETIKNFATLPEDFTLERGELTPSMKVKRRVLDQKYGETIEDLYR
ncbi:MAG: long-chain fatty acid--CoA ligase [Bdellovibrionales bacterium]|nr:long-chain fatty acid--CoA ligase [Bdellovibrionales bacterium]